MISSPSGTFLSISSQSKQRQTKSEHHFIHGNKRNAIAQYLRRSYPHIPSETHPFIFPLYHPRSVDIVLFWSLPSLGRSGHVTVRAGNIGVDHAVLRDIVELAENAKSVRSMYAETQRQRAEILQGIKESEWNTVSDPLVVNAPAEKEILHDFSKGYVLEP